jgi:lycopene beta-cyclase
MKSEVDADICILGIGLSGCSLALALLERGYTGRIVMFDKASDITAQKTWCFWDENALPNYLRRLICKRWPFWSIDNGHDSHRLSASSSYMHYCCIKAEDFYAVALARLNKAKNVALHFNTPAEPSPSDSHRVSAVVGAQRVSARWGFDARGVGSNQYKPSLFQCFTGAWVRTESPSFDEHCAQLMSGLKTFKRGLEFTYTLPLDRYTALIEFTRFSSSSEDLALMSQMTKTAIEDQLNDKFTIHSWEQGILPMDDKCLESRIENETTWHKIGISAGHIRASTGYAFVNIQKFCQAAAHSIVDNQTIQHRAYPKVYEWLDAVFLRVLQQNKTISPALFLKMADRTDAGQFARFMSEKATFGDLMTVIGAMPKRPFLRALWHLNR